MNLLPYMAKGFGQMDYVKDFDIGRLLWISQLWQGEVTQRKGAGRYNFAVFEDGGRRP